MTRDGLNTLKEIERKVSKLREKVGNLEVRFFDFYTLEEDVEDREAYEHLADARDVMYSAEMNLMYVVRTLKKAYNAEKNRMDTYDGLLNDKSNE